MGHLDADRYRCKTSFRVPYRYNDFILTYFAEKFNFNKKEHGLSVVLWGSSNPMKRQAFALLIVLACLREGAFRGVLQKRENPRKTVAIPRKNQYNGTSNQRASGPISETRKGARTMKKRCLALLLTLVLCIGMAIPAGASQFQDVPDGHWASDAVDYVVEKGLFNGTSATTFSPDSGMTRAMLTVVLYRYAGSPAVTGTVASETPFQDIPEGAYYGDAVVWAYQNDIFPDWIVSQDGGDHNRTTFAPDSPTPRLDFAQMLYQFSLYLTGEAPAEAGEELPFVDVTQEALYQVLAAAYPYYLSDEADVAQIQVAVSWAYTQGIMNGTSETTLSPDRTISRAQVAVMLMRFDGAYGSALFQLEVLQLVNQARADQGLAPLTADPALTAAAQTRAEELTTLYSHTRPDGSSCFTALTEAGVAYWAAGENIAAGYATPEAVVAGWMASDGHRANILSEDFTQMGLGYAPAEDGYGHYWAQLFVG